MEDFVPVYQDTTDPATQFKSVLGKAGFATRWTESAKSSIVQVPLAKTGFANKRSEFFLLFSLTLPFQSQCQVCPGHLAKDGVAAKCSEFHHQSNFLYSASQSSLSSFHWVALQEMRSRRVFFHFPEPEPAALSSQVDIFSFWQFWIQQSLRWLEQHNNDSLL